MTFVEQSFKAKYPQFAGYDSDLIAAWVAEAERAVDECYFGDRFDYAIELWLAWHLLDLDKGQMGITGPLTSHSKGGESWSFGSSDDGAGNIYQSQYKKLVRDMFRGGFVV